MRVPLAREQQQHSADVEENIAQKDSGKFQQRVIEPASDQETATEPPPAGDNGAADDNEGAAVVDGGRLQQQHAGKLKAASGLWSHCAQMAK